MSDAEIRERIARVETKIEGLEENLREAVKELKALNAWIENNKGAWRMVVLIAGGSSAITAAVIKVLPWMFAGPWPK